MKQVAPLDEINLLWRDHGKMVLGKEVPGGIDSSVAVLAGGFEKETHEIEEVENSEDEFTLLALEDIIRQDHYDGEAINSTETTNDVLRHHSQRKKQTQAPEDPNTHTTAIDIHNVNNHTEPSTQTPNHTNLEKNQVPLTQHILQQLPDSSIPDTSVPDLTNTQSTQSTISIPSDDQPYRPLSKRINKTGKLSDILSKMNHKSSIRAGLRRTSKIESLHRINK